MKNNKDHPIIICTDLIPSVIDGSKTQTRRTRNLDIINKEPNNFTFLNITKHPLTEGLYRFRKISKGTDYLIKCPYGTVGSRLWVRETWLDEANGEPLGRIEYAADYPMTVNDDGEKLVLKREDYKWTSPIFMPKDASRITLEITDIRIERLQKITPFDCLKEGIKERWTGYRRDKFKDLWNTLHKKEHRWDDDPWVWVICFKKVDVK